jgi:class 3 adenylate cyclase/tetratricopeptide (TPR) repeat protein
MQHCPGCGAENPDDHRFCGACGAALDAACPSCGAAAPPGQRFCGQCGASLSVATSVADQARPAPIDQRNSAHTPSAQVSERRVCSVLFVDLVGFTSLSESRDPEEVRELLSRYFDTARAIVDRYGGTIEKFIGDAVMAVWGVPVTNEDDAERAVRAALDLVGAVAKPDADAPALTARAAVLTGDMAVSIGASGQGMVAGDVVNTASRLQSAAQPGTVLVGETTYLSARDAVAFEDEGEFELKGKGEPIRAWRAVRVVAQRRGVGRADRMEPPFVGRDDELRLLVDLLHQTARERKARLVSVSGIGGIGKSRLVWELLKYVDGLAETVLWHHGRSPAYGEGITFWALAEMVRMRTKISELEDPASARQKLEATLEQFVTDPEERRWIEPRIAHLLGLAEAPSGQHQELFSAWRTFFERIAERGPVVMVFEDLQWADAGLIDFVESIVEWSRNSPILVITLSRPELSDRRPTWGAGTRNFTTLHLEPLDDPAMRALLHGLVRALPEPVTEQLVRRADGVPLYAVETVRALLDRGVIVQLDDVYELLGDASELEIPDSLHALIASRLDTLPVDERALVQDAAVLGKTFALPALAAISGHEEERAAELVHNLVRREVLVLDSDSRSPERGQYGFIQSIVREVAYGTLSKRDRRAKHLAAAKQFELSEDEEFAGLVAAHYAEAYRASAPGPEGEEVASLALQWLRLAAERALSLGSPEQALGYAGDALEITATGGERAALLELAGMAARLASETVRSMAYLEEAIAYYEASGDRVAVGRVTIELVRSVGTAQESGFAAVVEQTSSAFAALGSGEADDVRADLAVGVSHVLNAMGDRAHSLEWAETALGIAERLDDPVVLGRALTARASALFVLGRHREAAIVERGAWAIAEASGLLSDQSLSLLHLSLYVQDDDPHRAWEAAIESAALARRAGERTLESTNLLNAAEMLLFTGEWEIAQRTMVELSSNDIVRGHRVVWLKILDALLLAVTADEPSAIVLLERTRAELESAEYIHMRTTYLRASAMALLARGNLGEARADAAAAVAADPDGINSLIALSIWGRAALWLGDEPGARGALAGMATFHGRWAIAARATIEAGLAALGGGGADAARQFRATAELWRALRTPLDLALCGMDTAYLFDPGDQPEDLVAEARGILTGIGAIPLLAQLDARVGVAASVAG